MSSKRERLDQIEILPYSMKGYELYSWKEHDKLLFKLIYGTNRKKQVEEILDDCFDLESQSLNVLLSDYPTLIALLAKLPDGSIIIVNEGIWWDEFNNGLTEVKIIDSLREKTKHLNVQLIY